MKSPATDRSSSTKQVTRAIKNLIGRDGVFGCVFIKKDGTRRSGSFRLGVKKGLKSVKTDAEHLSQVPATKTERDYDPEDQGILIVWDMTKGGYRSIPLDKVIQISVHGVTIKRESDGWYADGLRVYLLDG